MVILSAWLEIYDSCFEVGHMCRHPGILSSGLRSKPLDKISGISHDGYYFNEGLRLIDSRMKEIPDI